MVPTALVIFTDSVLLKRPNHGALPDDGAALTVSARYRGESLRGVREISPGASSW
jgi:hypothetical protein